MASKKKGMTYFTAPSVLPNIAHQIKANFEALGTPLLQPFYPKAASEVLEAEEFRNTYELNTPESFS